MELLLSQQPNVDIDAEFSLMPLWVQRAIKLYNRCRMFNEITLPCAGGVLDQDELTVVILERIYGKHQQIMADRMEQLNRRIKQQDGKSLDSIQIGKSYSQRSRS